MDALILSGGKGTRLRPLTLYAPKPLLPIANTPFLGYPLALLRRHGGRRVVLCTSDALSPYRRFIAREKRSGTEVLCSKETRELGTAGAVKNAEPFVKGSPFFVFNGDILTDFELGAMVRFHRARKARVTVALVPVEDPSPYGLALLRRDGAVRRFIEKPGPSDLRWGRPYLINAGIYLLEREVLSLIPAGRPFSMERELFPLCLRDGVPLYGFAGNSRTYWLDIGTPQRYLQANFDASAGRLDRVLRHPGPRPLVAQGARLGAGARVSRETVIGAGCRVGRGSTLARCVLLDNVVVGDGCVLEDCVVGGGARIGDHSVLKGVKAVGDRSVITPYSRL